MPNYSNGKIYKITGGGLTYIGSTTETLARRLSNHRSTKNYITSLPLLDFDDCCITLVEDVPCERKEQLHMRERYHIENTECVNKIIPLRTRKEWCEANKEIILKKNLDYYYENKEHLNTLQKKWKSENKDKIKEATKKYNEKVKVQKNLYRQENKEKCRENDRLYYQMNKEKICQRKKERDALKKLQKQNV